MSEFPSAAEVIAGVIKRAEDDAYLHGAWNSRPDVEPQAVLDALREKGWAVVKLPEPTATDDDGQVFFGEYDVRADPTGSRQFRRVITDFGLGSECRQEFTPAGARYWAGLLLAAAAAVSQDGDSDA